MHFRHQHLVSVWQPGMDVCITPGAQRRLAPEGYPRTGSTKRSRWNFDDETGAASTVTEARPVLSASLATSMYQQSTCVLVCMLAIAAQHLDGSVATSCRRHRSLSATRNLHLEQGTFPVSCRRPDSKPGGGSLAYQNAGASCCVTADANIPSNLTLVVSAQRESGYDWPGTRLEYGGGWPLRPPLLPRTVAVPAVCCPTERAHRF